MSTTEVLQRAATPIIVTQDQETRSWVAKELDAPASVTLTRHQRAYLARQRGTDLGCPLSQWQDDKILDRWGADVAFLAALRLDTPGPVTYTDPTIIRALMDDVVADSASWVLDVDDPSLITDIGWKSLQDLNAIEDAFGIDRRAIQPGKQADS